MVKERVNTGGLKTFIGSTPERDFELEEAIDEGYEKARIRKKRNRIITIIIVIVILAILGLSYLIF